MKTDSIRASQDSEACKPVIGWNRLPLLPFTAQRVRNTVEFHVLPCCSTFVVFVSSFRKISEMKPLNPVSEKTGAKIRIKNENKRG